MSISILQNKQSLQAKIAIANEKIVTLEKRLRTLDDELASHLSQRSQYLLLDEIGTSLDKLSGMGGANLFWDGTGIDPAQQLQRVRATVAGFEQKISELEQQRGILQTDIQNEQAAVRTLSKQLTELQEKADKPSKASVSERPAREVSRRAMPLPWSREGEDERRFHRILFAILFSTIVFGGLVPFFRPPVEKSMGIVVPDRIARIIKKKQEAKKLEQKPAEKVAEKKEEKPEEKPEEKDTRKDKPKPITAEAKKARRTAETKGVLAFKNNFADLMKDSASSKIGAAARIPGNVSPAPSEAPQRSIIVSQATGGSGGINTSELNLQSEGGAARDIAGAGVKFSHIESTAVTGGAAATGAGSRGTDRNAGKEGQLPRSDEEIQIVFDRYKSALFRIYNRELRNNPALHGRMVLRVVIEPDGRVSSCSVKSTDMDSPALSAEIVERVLKINFGAKEGIPAVTILYPIDFMPAS